MYEKPTVVSLGSLAELTRDTFKQIGAADGIILIPDTSLTNVS